MDVVCPICGNQLPNEKYNLALKKLQEKIAETNKSQLSDARKKFDFEIDELVHKHKSQIDVLTNSQKKQLEALEDTLKRTHESEIARQEKRHGELDLQQKQEQLNLENELKKKHQFEMDSKSEIIKTLEQERVNFKTRASEEAKQAAQGEMDKLQKEIIHRDVQLMRANQEVEVLKKQLSQSQAELKGEAGEIDLYIKLEEAFPEDQFRRQKRGKSTGDIVQQIRRSGIIVDTPIVYDNKEAESITTADIVKAKKYQHIHATKYVVLVSTNLPKRDAKSGLLGDKDGIYLVHPSILIPFVKYLREGIIELSVMSNSGKDRDSKEVLLYDYIRSPEFMSRMEKISKIQNRFGESQEKEIKDHEKMWRLRKHCLNELEREHTEISMKIQTILSKEEDRRDIVAKVVSRMGE